MTSCTGKDLYKILTKDKTIAKYIKHLNLMKKIRKIRNKLFENIKEFKKWLSKEIKKMGHPGVLNFVVCNYVENVYNKNSIGDNNDNSNDRYYKTMDRELKRLKHNAKPININKSKKLKHNKSIKHESDDEEQEEPSTSKMHYNDDVDNDDNDEKENNVDDVNDGSDNDD